MSGRPRSPFRRRDDRRDDRRDRDRDYRRDDRRDSRRDGRDLDLFDPRRYDRDGRRDERDYRRDDRRDDRSFRRTSPPPDYVRRPDFSSFRPNFHFSNPNRLPLNPEQRRGSRDDRVPAPTDRDRHYDARASRERSPVMRDRRYRSRERLRESHDSREPDRKRSRRTDSVESKRSRADARAPAPAKQVCHVNSPEERAHRLTGQTIDTSAADKAAEEEKKKLERQAKVEAWKKKQEEKKKEKELTASAADSPATATASPAAIASPRSKASPSVDNDDDEQPAKPFAGKFDPKAIAKRAAAATAKLQTLGADINIPGKSKSAATPATTSKAADPSKKTPSTFSKGTGALSAKSALNALNKGFQSQTATEEQSSPQNVPGIDMEDDEDVQERRILEKLPTPEIDDTSADAAIANDVQMHDDQDDDNDEDITNAGTEEEFAAAARAAAEKRAAEAAERSINEPMDDADATSDTNGDENMADADDEVDPLDAYMSGLVDDEPQPAKKLPRNRLLEPEAMFDTTDSADLEAVGDELDDALALAVKKKRKEMPTVDHAKVEYEPFRKNFYTEPLELQQMSEDDVRALRFELDQIKVKGKDVPVPVQKFAQFGLGTQVLDIIRGLGFDAPTPIQAQTIPAIMSGRDIIGVAKTGSGKTVAFLLPMFRHIKDQRPLANLEGPIGLVMAPTRELAVQIHKECKPYLKALSLRAVCCYGGAPIKDQISELKRGADIIVCTPGRLVDLLAANSGRVTNLRRVTYVVLDEADRMFDMGFEPQVVKVLKSIRPDHQTVLFSATMPKNMESLAKKVLRRPVEITVGGRSTVADTIDQIIEIRPESSKMYKVLELLGDLFEKDEDARALIFVEQQGSADNMMMQLQMRGYPSVSIHGGRDQIDRDTAIEDFKSGVVPVMVATSVAARGLDVKQLKLVINYDVPNHLEDYVHRVGRTGRAGAAGTAVTLITPDQNKYSVDLVKALKMSKKDVPEDLQTMADNFIKKVNGGEAKAAGFGFGGRGVDRLEEKRAAERARERKSHRIEGEEDPDDDEKDDKKTAEEGVDLAINVIKRGNASASPAPEALPSNYAGIDLNGKITVHKTETPAPTASAGTGTGTGNKMESVLAAANKINSRLGARGSTRPGVPIDNKGPDAGAYHATLEINDFPQKARWSVTNRTNVAKILDATGVSITTKGTFFPPPTQPKEGDNPKLYILVEGDTENQVTNAMRELQRLLREGVIAAAESDSRAPVSGRYTVT
ncbi:hypothetical protein MBLNU459_g6960t1 [Dothideomycetes sp. NU459]